jgi:hypothetical protein
MVAPHPASLKEWRNNDIRICSEAPNRKHQITNKHQIQNLNGQDTF